MLGFVKQNAEADTEKRAGKSKPYGVERRNERKLGDMKDLKGFPVKSEISGDLSTDKGCKDTGHKRRIIGNTDADDLDPKHGSRQRCSENRPKAGAHSAHDHDLLIPLIHMEHIAEIISDTSADL